MGYAHQEKRGKNGENLSEKRGGGGVAQREKATQKIILERRVMGLGV